VVSIFGRIAQPQNTYGKHFGPIAQSVSIYERWESPNNQIGYRNG